MVFGGKIFFYSSSFPFQLSYFTVLLLAHPKAPTSRRRCSSSSYQMWEVGAVVVTTRCLCCCCLQILERDGLELLNLGFLGRRLIYWILLILELRDEL
jgi:hypothetical protein